MPSTAKHLTLYKAFRWEPPKFAHVGLLQNDERQKLSKRSSALALESLADDGYLPEAVVNFVALMGWTHNLKDEKISLQDLVKRVSEP